MEYFDAIYSKGVSYFNQAVEIYDKVETITNVVEQDTELKRAEELMNSAMPILENADSIEVFAVEPHGIGDIPGADIATHLARHGLKAEASKTTGIDIDVGDVLLNQVADSGADMVVMGAYGHSRMRELVLGGATRRLLEHMTVPVLLSH